MKKWFPTMTDRPEGRQVVLGALYWLVYLLLLPGLLNIFVQAFGWTYGNQAVAGVCWYWINGLLVFLIFRGYLRDSFWNWKLDRKKSFSALGIGLLAFFVVRIPILLLDPGFPVMPVADTMNGLPLFLFAQKTPVLFSLAIVTAVPLTMSCLYCAVAFAPLCERKPWLGYLAVAVLSCLPWLLQIPSSSHWTVCLRGYLYRLPFHLCACWVCEQSDSVWGAVFFHGALNLLDFLAAVLLLLL